MTETAVDVVIDGRALRFATAEDAAECRKDMIHYGTICVVRDDAGNLRRLDPLRHRDFHHATFRNTATV